MKKNAKKDNKLASAIVNIFELPPEAILNTPLITLTGRHSITLENYTCLAEYTPDHIKINTREGGIHLYGSGIAIKEISSDSIVLAGSFTRLEYEI